MGEDHWLNLFRAWSTLAKPVTVSGDVIDAIKAEISSIAGRMLLLGTTRGLLNAGPDLVAIDRSPGVVGDLSQIELASRLVVGDWLSLPFPAASFAACIGDGSLISFDFPSSLHDVLHEIARCLKPGGKLVCRTFMSPERPDTLTDVVSEVGQRKLTFQHFKFKFAMALAAKHGVPNIAVASIPDSFDEEFPDRDALAGLTGWDRAEIETIEIYRSSRSNYCFPSRSQLRSVLPKAFKRARFVSVPNHPFGDEWPVAVFEVR